MKPETYVCIQGCAVIPKGSIAEFVEGSDKQRECCSPKGVYRISHNGKQFYALGRHLIEQNPECWRKESEWQEKWPDGEKFMTEEQYNELDDLAGKVLNKPLAEQKRQESIGGVINVEGDIRDYDHNGKLKTVDGKWLPYYGRKYKFWHLRKAVLQERKWKGGHRDISNFQLGNCHRTAEDAKYWWQKRGKYFQIPNQDNTSR